MSATETPDLIEWRASPWWVWGWALILGGLVLPCLTFGGWLALRDIERMREWAWPIYVLACQIFVGLILGAIVLAVLSTIVAYIALLFDSRPILRADRRGVEVRLPFKPLRTATWDEVEAIEIERKRRTHRATAYVWHVIFRLRDKTAPELTIQPQMADIELEAGGRILQGFFAQMR